MLTICPECGGAVSRGEHSIDMHIGRRTVSIIGSFERCNGENELISNKSSGNIYRYNTLVDSPGAQLSLRHGNDCLVYGNYLRNTEGRLLIDPTTGLPIRSSTFIDAGYDRQPDYTIGLSNTFRFNRVSMNFLLDIRKGGDVFNATEQYLTARGLSKRTLDRDKPRVIDGVLRDGRENTATPTVNSIVVVPSVQTSYYSNISEELFIEKDINWLRLRDVTVNYVVPERILANASVFVTGTDLFLFSNYSGLDPIVNGNSAAVGGSGAAGIDYGNFPIPRGLNFGIRMGF